jgi:hypothetical protein
VLRDRVRGLEELSTSDVVVLCKYAFHLRSKIGYPEDFAANASGSLVAVGCGHWSMGKHSHWR